MQKKGGKIKNNGLSAKEVDLLLRQYGENTVIKKRRIGPLLVFLEKLKNPLLILLVIISIASLSLGQKASATIVLMMVFLSAILDFFNSYKSQQAVEKLIAKVATRVFVLRDGEKKEIEARLIVPGDIIYLSAGNVIPADCALLESDDFFVNQSSLTGESIPVEKVVIKNTVDSHELNIERFDLVFMGTSVVSGFATVKVLRTGLNTEFGKIAAEMNRAEPKTDFEISITKFSIFIMRLVFYMVSFVFLIYLFKNSENLNKDIILEAFTFALAITIGVTPDMLPAIITVCLAKGSQMMEKKGVIVKHLSSIENFGSMDILCTDKTGTLTQDHIALVKFINYKGIDSGKVLEYGYLSSIYHTGIDNPLDNAIKEFKKLKISQYRKVDEIPYDFTRKRSSMVVRAGDKKYLITKGAPEEILNICTRYELDNKIGFLKDKRREIEKRFSALSNEGFRVLAISYKEIDNNKTRVYEKEVETDMIFLGYLAFLDPPKDGVIKIIEDLRQFGIEIKILTGDNEILASKICRDIGIAITGVLTGKEIRGMNDFELLKHAKKANIFARITPDQKERIIMVLKKSGKSVGYLGDGINDAPALRVADVGISVNNAVDIAKETAGIILMRKNLDSLKDGVIEGRKTFHNTLKYVLMGLSSNFGNMFSMMGASAFLPFLPMLPSQILFNNFIYDISQFSLPTDRVDSNELLKPAHWDIKFIRSYMTVFGLISSIFDFLTFYLLYFVFHLSEHQFQTGWFIESIATQILVIYIIRTKRIPFIESSPSKALLATTLAAVAFAWFVQFTFLGKLLQFDQLPLRIMMIIVGYVVIYLALVELVKRVFYRQYAKLKH